MPRVTVTTEQHYLIRKVIFQIEIYFDEYYAQKVQYWLKPSNQNDQVTCEPFLLPGKFTISVVPRIPHTGLKNTQVIHITGSFIVPV